MQRDELNRKMHQIDSERTRSDNYAGDADMALRVLSQLASSRPGEPWPGKGEPRVDVRWGYDVNKWQVVLYDFVPSGDPGDGMGVRPFYHHLGQPIAHESLAIAGCLAAIALHEWLQAKRVIRADTN